MLARAVRTLGRPERATIQPFWPQAGLGENTPQTTPTVAPDRDGRLLHTMLCEGVWKPHQCTSAAGAAPAVEVKSESARANGRTRRVILRRYQAVSIRKRHAAGVG